MNSGSKFLPSRSRSKTIESTFSDGFIKDQIEQWLYASGYIHDNEELINLDISLPKNIQFKFTVKKQGGSRTPANETKEGL